MKFKSLLDRIVSFCWLFPKLNNLLYLKSLNNDNNFKIFVTCFGKWELLFESNIINAYIILLSFTKILWGVGQELLSQFARR